MDTLPLVDLSPLLDPDADDASRRRVGEQIDAACRGTGFLLVTGHGVDPGLRDDLERLSRDFFALPEQIKAEIAMAKGGRTARRASTSAPSSRRTTRAWSQAVRCTGRTCSPTASSARSCCGGWIT